MSDTINGLRLGGVGQSISKQELLRQNATSQSFLNMLQEQLGNVEEPLKFSKHAQERMSQRGIELSTEQMTSLRDAVDKARDKGARDLVVLNASSAFIVNVPNNTVVTTITGSELKENIFTNIDSAVLI